MEPLKCGEIDPETGASCHSTESNHAKHLGRVEGTLVSWPNVAYQAPKRKIGSRRMHEIAKTLRASAG